MPSCGSLLPAACTPVTVAAAHQQYISPPVLPHFPPPLSHQCDLHACQPVRHWPRLLNPPACWNTFPRFPSGPPRYHPSCYIPFLGLTEQLVAITGPGAPHNAYIFYLPTPLLHSEPTPPSVVRLLTPQDTSTAAAQHCPLLKASCFPDGPRPHVSVAPSAPQPPPACQLMSRVHCLPALPV